MPKRYREIRADISVFDMGLQPIAITIQGELKVRDASIDDRGVCPNPNELPLDG